MTSFNAKAVGFAFAYYAWGHFCLLQKERSLPDYQDIPTSIYYPVVFLAFAGILDNIRLLLGLGYGKEGASKCLAQLAHFTNHVILPSLVATYSTLFTSLTGCSWLGTLGHIATVPLVMNGLNVYVSEVHDNMEYTDKEQVPKYTLVKKQSEAVVDQELPLTLYVVLGGAVFVSLIALFSVGDILPLLLQVAVVGGLAVLPSVSPSLRTPVSHGLDLLCLAGIMRLQRYV